MNRRAVGFGFMVTGVLVLLVKWALYFYKEVIFNGNYEYISYVGYAVLAVGVVYLLWAEIESLRGGARAENRERVALQERDAGPVNQGVEPS